MQYSMPVPLRQARKRHKATGVLLLVILLVVLLPAKKVILNRNQELPSYPKKRQLQSPLVCSHQVLNPPPFLPGQKGLYSSASTGDSSSLLPLDGSLDAMTALWYNGGVTCFDIDVVVLSDGNMLASHPRRLKAAILDRTKEDKPEDADIALEEFTLDSIRNVLGIRQNVRSGNNNAHGNGSSPFPLFDTEVLPHFGRLVRGIPGAFAKVEPSRNSMSTTLAPWELKGPLLNVDLKLGPYLTEQRVLKLTKQIHSLGLEDYVAICVTNPEPPRVDHHRSDASMPLDLLDVLHSHNIQSSQKSIPVGLVLRDRVPEDAEVNWVRQVVEELYPESIKALVPSFKFSHEWYDQIRNQGIDKKKLRKRELWQLPMTVWTIDSEEDYTFVSSLKVMQGENDQTSKGLSLPIVSAVIANKPMDIIQ